MTQYRESHKQRWYREDVSRFRSKRSRGWGMNLYRNTRESRIAGVAAGLADYWDVAHWVVRLAWFAAFLFTGSLAFWAYIAGWIVLSPRPQEDSWRRSGKRPEQPGPEDSVDMEYDEELHEYRPRKAFRYSDPSSERLRRARERMDAALARVESMESYVTSRRYRLNKEFSEL